MVWSVLRLGLAAGLACRLVTGDAALAQTAPPAQPPGQATAPSSITPGTLRPPPVGGDGATVLAPSDGLTPPPGTAALSVALSTLEVEGGFPEVARETAAIAARLAHRTVTLGEIYAAAPVSTPSGADFAWDTEEGHCPVKAVGPEAMDETGLTELV